MLSLDLQKEVKNAQEGTIEGDANEWFNNKHSAAERRIEITRWVADG